MVYMTVLIVTYQDETPKKTAIYTLDSAELAVASVYKYMGQYMCAENVATVCCMAINSIGDVYKNERWVSDQSVFAEA